jgi:hypothetical protein
MKFFIPVICLAALLTSLPADEIMPANQSFTAGKFSFSVTPTGIIENLKNGDIELVSSVRLTVKPVRGESDTENPYIVQGNKYSTASLAVKQEGDLQQITVQGCLANALYKAADYTEILSVSPAGIKAETTVTLLRDIHVLTWESFRSLLLLPNALLDGSTARIMNVAGADKTFTFPEKSSNQRYPAFFGCKAFVLELPNMGIKITNEDNAYMLLFDGTWHSSQETANRLLIFRPTSVRYSEQPVLLEKGTLLKWTWSVFEHHED